MSLCWMWCNFPIRYETPQVSGQGLSEPTAQSGAMDSSSPQPGPLPPALSVTFRDEEFLGVNQG